jgi:hypothetical protein
MNSNEHAFDTTVQACHAVALQRLSPQVQAQLAQRRNAALRGQASNSQASRGQAGQPARRNGMRYAVAGFAAVGALAFGLQLQRPTALAPILMPSPTTTTASPDPGADTLLDQDPEFYAWLASPDARQLAME